MNGENQPLVTHEPVEFEKQLIQIQDLKQISMPSRISRGIFLSPIKENRKMSTCNPLGLETPGSRPVMPKKIPELYTNLPRHMQKVNTVVVGRHKGVLEAQVHSTCQLSTGVFPKKYQILLGFNGACKSATFPMQQTTLNEVQRWPSWVY